MSVLVSLWINRAMMGRVNKINESIHLADAVFFLYNSLAAISQSGEDSFSKMEVGVGVDHK